MLLGPVFQAEMVTTARRTRYFVLRVLFAAGLLLCLWSCYEGVAGWSNRDGRLSIGDAARLAGAFFQAFAWLTLFAAMLVTPAIAAGAIATERERRTIEYLFATDLSNAEIVLSKLFAKLLLVGKLILVALPVLAIFRLLGGIPGNLLVVYFAGLASTVALFTMGSMCISVWSARARDAIIRVYLVGAVLFIVPLILWMPLASTAGWTGSVALLLDLLRTAVGALLTINPLYVLGEAVSGGSALGMGASNVWRMIALHVAMTIVLAAVAVGAVRRVHLRSVSSPGSSETRRPRWQLPRYRPPLRTQPMLWKEMFARTAATKLGFLGRISIAIIFLVAAGSGMMAYLSTLYSQTNYGWSNPGRQYLGTSMTVTGFLGVGAVILMGLRAAGQVTYEKERDCWLSLLATPLTGQEIITAKAAGNLYAFRWMLLPLAIVWLLQLTLSPQFIIAIPMHLVTITATGLFATAVGLAYSLKFDSSLKAIGATMGTLFFVGGGYLLCCCMPLAIAGSDDEIFKIALAGFVPFLQVAPGLMLVEEHVFDEGWVVFDYFAGTIGYAIAGGVILASLSNHFDAIVGRTGSEFPSDLPSTPTASSTTST